MNDEEFLSTLVKCATTVKGVLQDEAWKSFVTTAYLIYLDRTEIKALVSEEGEAYSFEVIYQFGKTMAAQGVQAPPALFVAAEAETEGRRELCLFISGCTLDGRRKSMHVLLERTRWRKILRPKDLVLHYQSPQQTSAGELMRGLLEKAT